MYASPKKEYYFLDECLTNIDNVNDFWIDIKEGHNYVTMFCLHFSCNTGMVSNIDFHIHKTYAHKYGYKHLCNSTRNLQYLQDKIKIIKIDESFRLKKIPKQIGYIINLEEFYQRQCKLSGKIPNEIENLKNLNVLSLGNNNLTGSLPKCILNGSLNCNRIILHQNKLTINLNNIDCKYIICLTGNKFIDNINTDVPQHERDFLINFYNSCIIKNDKIFKNWCTNMPVREWNKIGVINNNIEIIMISDEDNKGYIPENIKTLKKIKMIELSKINILGKCLQNISNLNTLQRLCICNTNLYDSIPESLGNLIMLKQLQLFNNNLSGKIPQSLENLTNLELLSLGEYSGGNNFYPGEFPVCIKNMKKLKHLFLAKCNIIGEIPEWLWENNNIQLFDIQDNKLTGCISDSISNLTKLTYFNCKKNQLNGRLPIESFKKLNILNRISLIENNFENIKEIICLKEFNKQINFFI
jgi:hypothetical protein